ncbi:MAG: hypothetical protein IPG08_10275 [Sphingobacteriaceae bacterium]|nr:hypothetical protein [Sphingobacteriaceae bacterium]
MFENRASVWEELNNAEEKLKKYLKQEFSNLLRNPNILEWIDGHVERGSPPATYFILEE